MPRKHLEPPHLLFACLVAMTLLYLLLPIYFWIHYPWSWIGLLPICIGATLNLSADSSFKKADTTVKPSEVPSNLIQSGPFRITRHPMYLGMTLILLGAAILFGALSALLPVILFPICMEILFISMEERKMAAEFGAAWDKYKKRVRRWI